jgi:hypothetical protein
MIIIIDLILGCFPEGNSIFLITIPVFLPIMARYGLDLINLGVVMTLLIMIGNLTPPVGMCLFAVSSFSKVGIMELAKECGPYIVARFLPPSRGAAFAVVCRRVVQVFPGAHHALTGGLGGLSDSQESILFLYSNFRPHHGDLLGNSSSGTGHRSRAPHTARLTACADEISLSECPASAYVSSARSWPSARSSRRPRNR